MHFVWTKLYNIQQNTLVCHIHQAFSVMQRTKEKHQ
jgi:hypothetical protein